MSSIVIYIPDDGSEEEGDRAMLDMLETFRDDPILLACIVEDAIRFAQERDYPFKWQKELRDLRRLTAVTY